MASYNASRSTTETVMADVSVLTAPPASHLHAGPEVAQDREREPGRTKRRVSTVHGGTLTSGTTADFQEKRDEETRKKQTEKQNGDSHFVRKEDEGWRRIVRNFTPSWFAVTMGTGIVSILVHNLPYNGAWLQYISYIFFALNVALFTVFTALSVLRYTLYPEIWTVMVQHPTQSLFVGCFPMGLATIINMILLACPTWGLWTVYLSLTLWTIDALISLTSCILILFPIMHHHDLQTSRITAALLLPFVPCVVAAASGGLLASSLLTTPVFRPDLAITVLIASYVLWGIGLSFSAIVIALYFQRLCLHALPPREVIVSVFLPVGPLGQGGFGIQQLGKVAMAAFPTAGTFGATETVGGGGSPVVDLATRVGEIFYAQGIFLALLMWGAGLAWLAFAVVTVARMSLRGKGGFPFNMGWWGFTFPLGVFATCTGSLASELDSTVFRVLTMVFSLAVVALWVLVASRTVARAANGTIFHAPCLANLPAKGSSDSEENAGKAA